ncbi:MAG: hypoxanthine phosphoribosyltransferase [Gammaproteobacteria bacterium]|nr:hypoxanthine phosphoribosyltransferase [Gammaproteobacteria bacterium]NND60712.1 hypoxanthine phosphoribosyltransferase [Gammaproteobacteria bacterium]
MEDRAFVGADELLLDSFRLATTIADSDFRPDFLVGLWRGGSAVGIAVQEGLDYLDIATDHIPIRTSYAGRSAYSERLAGRRHIRVHGLDYLLERVASGHSMLIVDDVYSTGHSVQAVIEELERKSRRNLPRDIRIASVWFRPNSKTVREPDFYVHKTDRWLVLPYELSDLTPEEIRASKPELAPILDSVSDRLQSRPK